MPQSQKDVADNLYEFLQQWFTLFPKFQANDFYPFGESYAGRFVPTIARRIHEENQGSPKVRINLAGMGIGDGWMSPYHNTRYGEFLYQVKHVFTPVTHNKPTRVMFDTTNDY